MRPVRVDPRAAGDLARATVWYDAQQPNLGTEFLVQVDDAIYRAVSAPFSYSPFRRHTRRVLLRRFPYAIYYVVEDEVILVLAVLHQRRGSSAWRGRVQEAAVGACA